jgi:putative phosphoribosyl transferase
VIFRDRRDAGRALGRRLSRRARRPDVVVLALPRGGVPVGFEVAREVGAPLDVFLVRKLGVPGHEELAMGAIAAGGVRVLQEDVIADLGISAPVVEAATRREEEELRRREREFRQGRPPAAVAGKTVILVDDGLATGATMRAAIAALRRLAPSAVVVAVPVGAPETCAAIARLADECVCLETPPAFSAVGCGYADFEQTTDEEVRELLEKSAAAA